MSLPLWLPAKQSIRLEVAHGCREDLVAGGGDALGFFPDDVLGARGEGGQRDEVAFQGLLGGGHDVPF